MNPRLYKWLFISGGVLVVFIAALLLFISNRPQPPSLPKPNGYEDFMRAAAMIPEDMPEVTSLNLEQLQNLNLTNSEALKIARAGLERECRVIQPNSSTDLSVHVQQIGGLKRLARAFIAEAKAAELQNQAQKAANTYIELVTLGHCLLRGGLIIDALVGLSVENQGISRIQKLIPRLDAIATKSTTSKLEDLEARRVPASATLKEETGWVRRTYGLRGQFVRLVGAKSIKAGENNFVSKASQQATRNRELLIELASHAYEIEHGKRPQDISALIPNYLKQPPRDPVTGVEMKLPQ